MNNEVLTAETRARMAYQPFVINRSLLFCHFIVVVKTRFFRGQHESKKHALSAAERLFVDKPEQCLIAQGNNVLNGVLNRIPVQSEAVKSRIAVAFP